LPQHLANEPEELYKKNKHEGKIKMRPDAPRIVRCGNATRGDLLATAAVANAKTTEDVLGGGAVRGLEVGTAECLLGVAVERRRRGRGAFGAYRRIIRTRWKNKTKKRLT
jgi:hypothetical protein